MASPSQEQNIIEIEFDIGDSQFFLVEISDRTDAEVRLHELQRRKDGSVLEFFTVRGADPDTLRDLVSTVEGLSEIRLLDEGDSSALFSAISQSPARDGSSSRSSRTSTTSASSTASSIPTTKRNSSPDGSPTVRRRW